MATSNVTLGYTKAGRAAGGSESATYAPVTNNAAPDNLTTQAFTATVFAAVTIPAGMTGVIIVPPATNTGLITQKGVTGDTGNQLGALAVPYWMPLGSAAVLGFLCANSITLEFIWT